MESKSLTEGYFKYLSKELIETKSDNIYDFESLKFFAPPVQFKYFRASVKVYFKERKVSFKKNPKNIEFTLYRNDFSFNLDFLLYNRNAYVKLITTERMVRYWALNFIKVKEYYRKQGENIELWTIFNDRAGIASEEIYKWFSESVDQVIGWYSDKEKLEKLI